MKLIGWRSSAYTANDQGCVRLLLQKECHERWWGDSLVHHPTRSAIYSCSVMLQGNTISLWQAHPSQDIDHGFQNHWDVPTPLFDIHNVRSPKHPCPKTKTRNEKEKQTNKTSALLFSAILKPHSNTNEHRIENSKCQVCSVKRIENCHLPGYQQVNIFGSIECAHCKCRLLHGLCPFHVCPSHRLWSCRLFPDPYLCPYFPSLRNVAQASEQTCTQAHKHPNKRAHKLTSDN